MDTKNADRVRELECVIADLKAECAAARAAAPVSGPSDANRYARELATALWTKHYKADAPQWQVLPDTYGALSQIDNMTTGLCRAAPVSGQGDSAALIVRDVAELYYDGKFNPKKLMVVSSEDLTRIVNRHIDSRPRSEDSRAKVLEEAASAFDATSCTLISEHYAQRRIRALASTTPQKA